MKRETLPITFLILLTALMGLLIPFWPLVLISVALAAWYTPLYGAFIVALLADLIYGTPLGIIAPLHFVFCIFCMVCYLLRLFAVTFILKRGDSMRI